MMNFIQRHRRVAIAIAATLDVLLVAAAITLIVVVV